MPHPSVAAYYNATAEREELYLLCQARCLAWVRGSAGRGSSQTCRSSAKRTARGWRETALQGGKTACRVRVASVPIPSATPLMQP
jgi:hypothetical protein